MSFVCAFEETSRTVVFDPLEGPEGGLSPGQIDATASCSTPSPPRRALPRPDRPVVCPDFGLDRWYFIASISLVSALKYTVVVRMANVVVFKVHGVELVAVQDEGFACALCLNSEEVREEVERVEVRGCGLFEF